MNREKWLFSSGTELLMLDSDCDPIFGFYTRRQKYEAWRGIYTDEIFILTLAEVFLHADS